MKFTDILRSVIVENSRMEILVDKLTKVQGDKKPLLKPEELFALIVADPESKIEGGVDIDNFKGNFKVVKKVGPYTNWLIKQFLSIIPKDSDGVPIQKDGQDDKYYNNLLKKERSQFWEDLYKTTDDLRKFHRFKNKLEQEYRDINKLNMEKLNYLMLPYSLEKTKATKDEKEEAKQTYEHPGGEVVLRGSNWTVVKISDRGKLGKDAACFYGGNDKKPVMGESGWCTSSPGLSYFDRYIKDGPLYVILPNSPEEFMSGGPKVGNISGLPAKRYQFHFPSNQYMDANDRQIDLISFLKENPELKEYFKPEFAKGLTKQDGKELHMEYPNDSSSKFVALYGWDDLFKNMNKDLESFDFTNRSKQPLDLKFPKELGELKNLQTFFVEDALSEVPESLKELKKLEFISLPNNRNLKELPEFLADLPELIALSIKGTPSDIKIPERLQKRFTSNGGDVWFVHND